MITEQKLLEGAWCALEQAGRLLRGAVTLFDTDDAPTGMAIAMFGREELGRSKLLQSFAAEVKAGRTLKASEVNKRCDDHARKQAAGALSVQMFSAGPQLTDALNTLTRAKPGTDEYDKAQRTVDAATEAQRKRQPHDRHDARMHGLYVDLDETTGDWRRPMLLARTNMLNEILAAVNDYSNAFHQIDLIRRLLESTGIPPNQSEAFEHYASLVKAGNCMRDVPKLLPPVWPKHEA